MMQHGACRRLLSLLPALLVLGAAPLYAGVTTRVSVSSTGVQADAGSYTGDVAGAYGGRVAFMSAATNLVTGDTNNATDVFVYTPTTGVTHRVSVSSTGTQANGDSYRPTISNDGRYVAFGSAASNLVTGDTNARTDVFVHDLVTGQTTRVSIATGGAEGDADSGPLTAAPPAISPDGRFVAFVSYATNLVPGDTNGTADVFMHHCALGATARASVTASGTQPNSLMSAVDLTLNGTLVAFDTVSNNLLPTDTNGTWDVFIKTWPSALSLESLGPLSVLANGPSIGPSLSSDGALLAFASATTNFAANDTNSTHDIFIRTRGTGAVVRASSTPTGGAGNNLSINPCLSGDGRFLVFQSSASDLLPGDTNGSQDIFGYELAGGAKTRLSVSTKGAQGNAFSQLPRTNGNGRYVCFTSMASNLVPGDTNGNYDVFLRDRWAPSVVKRTPTGFDVSRNTTVRVTFDPKMNRATAKAAFRIKPVVAGTFAWNSNTMIFRPNAPLAWGQQYTVTITKDAKSAKGIALAGPVKWVFQVIPMPAPSMITSVAAAATRGAGAEIAVTLSQAARVQTTIRNLAGRVVAVLPETGCEAGTTRLLWSGKTLTGVNAPAGQWLVEVEASTPDGTLCRRLTTLAR